MKMMMMLSDWSLGLDGFAKARRPAIEDELRRIADKSSPALKRAIMSALQAGEKATIKALSEAITAGDVRLVMDLLGLTDLETRLGGAVAEIRNIVSQAGTASAASIPSITLPVGPSLDVFFDVANPRSLQWLQQYELNLIREISENTREGVRAAVTEGVQAGRNPRDVARQLRASTGLTARQEASVANYRKELETFHHRRSAKAWNLGGKKSKAPGGAGVYAIGDDGKPLDGITARRLRDFRYDRTLLRAMKDSKPLTPEQIDKMVSSYRQRMVAYRADTIARTEALRASNAGSYLAWKQAQEQGVAGDGEIRKFWRTAGDERVRLEHRSIPKLNPEGRPLDEDFVTPTGSTFLAPYGVGCRCVVIYRIVQS